MPNLDRSKLWYCIDMLHETALAERECYIAFAEGLLR